MYARVHARHKGRLSVWSPLFEALVCGGSAAAIAILTQFGEDGPKWIASLPLGMAGALALLAGLSAFASLTLWLLRVPRAWLSTPLAYVSGFVAMEYGLGGSVRMPFEPWITLTGLVGLAAYWWAWAVVPGRSWKLRVAGIGILGSFFIIAPMFLPH